MTCTHGKKHWGCPTKSCIYSQIAFGRNEKTSQMLHEVDDADDAPQDSRQSQGPSAPSMIRPDEVTASIEREDLAALGQSLLNHDDCKVNLNARNDTPLRLAARLGRLRVVEWLVHERHAAVNQANTNGATPLYFAAL